MNVYSNSASVLSRRSSCMERSAIGKHSSRD